ncbi:MAG: OmpA family protein [Candidatus Azobacteroides sp.]|jgi:outer membrane protein OmpA-like peptidoglycan-associated protein|nr:OmpA family protein [Candidatus Azobacteroides sp.]
MRKLKLFTTLSLCAVLLLASGCGSMSNTGKGAAIGGGGGAAIGAGLGAIFGKGQGAIIGAAIGTAVGAGAGAIIGNKMDKQQKELEQIQGAQVEQVTDKNNLQAIKVTFADGILFQTGKSDLSASSKNALSQFASSLRNNPNTDVTIYGHTDNTGTRDVNVKLSQQRAQAVADYLIGNGVASSRMTTQGMAYDQPVGDNGTSAGRAQNRRVEIYITANEQMINDAQQGN